MSNSDLTIVGIAIIGIVAVLAVAYGLTLTESSTTTFCCTSVITNPTLTELKLTSVCNSTDYFLPDDVQLIPATVTTVHNGTTTRYVTTSTSSPTVQIINSTRYTTTLITDVSTSFATTNTTNLNPESPSGEWAVYTCTFTP